ncbi:hypothetical protein [Micromonospora sediminicola]|uniref:hypothetical protein n=1 Tax=Micromonospora sediminicola TaxID=946078 RepID=UPI00378AD347
MPEQQGPVVEGAKRLRATAPRAVRLAAVVCYASSAMFAAAAVYLVSGWDANTPFGAMAVDAGVLTVLLALALVSVVAGLSLSTSGSLAGLRAAAGGAVVMAVALPFLMADQMAAGPRAVVGAAVLAHGVLLLWLPGRGQAPRWLAWRRADAASRAGQELRDLTHAPWF